MENINISNKQRVTVLAVLAAATGFLFAMLSAPFILQSIHGYEFLDPNVDYGNEIDNAAAQISDACVQERTDNKVVLNDEGIKDNLIAQLTGINFCDGIVKALLDSGEGWYLDSISFKDGFVEKIMRR